MKNQHSKSNTKILVEFVSVTFPNHMRAYSLPTGTDTNQIKTLYENDLLKIRLPHPLAAQRPTLSNS